MPYTTEQIKHMIVQEAQRQGMNPALALGIAQAESSFNPNAVGDNGQAIGLFQLHKAAAQDVGLSAAERYNIPRNIEGGIAYLKNRITREGDENRGISAYNQGIGMRGGQYSNPQYVQTVRSYQQDFQRQPGLMARMVKSLSPSSAEASTSVNDETLMRDLGLTRKAQAAAPPATQPPASISDEALMRDLGLTRKAPASPVPSPVSTSKAPAPAASRPPQGYEGEVQVLGPPGTAARQGLLGAAPTAATQLQMLGQQEAGRLEAERGVGSRTIPAMSGWSKPALATGISTGAGLLGLGLGTAAMPLLGPLAPAGPIVGEMAGSYMGRRANVALGLEEPGLVGDVASVVIPPAMRGVSKVATPVVKAAGKGIVKRLPGAATALHEEISKRLVGMADSLLPPVDSRTLYQQVAQYNPGITPTAVARDALEIVQAEMALQPSLRNSRLRRVAADLRKLTQSGPVPMEDFYAHQQRVGELVRDFRSKGGVGEGRIKQLYAAFHEDLETAASKGVQGAQELKDAIAASRKEHMAAEFSDLFQPGKNGVTIDPEGRVSLNGGRLESAWKAKLRRDKVFRDTLTPEDKAEVEGIIKLSQRLERLTTPRGGQRGSGRAAVGAAVGSAVGGPAGAALGVYGPEIFAKAMQTKAGRALVRKAMEETSKGGADTTTLNALAALVRQQMYAPAEPGPPEP